jgi:hypothetical protein
MGGDALAATCPFFRPVRKAEALKADFNRMLGLDGSVPVQIGFIAKEYPDLAALMWVIGPSENANTTDPVKTSDDSILAFFADGEDEEEEGSSVPERPLVEESDA